MDCFFCYQVGGKQDVVADEKEDSLVENFNSSRKVYAKLGQVAKLQYMGQIWISMYIVGNYLQ